MTLTQNWDKAGGEARTEEYRTWRTKLGLGAVGDLDQVEYDAETGRPIACIELCVADFGPSENFFPAVEAKVADTRPQGRMIRYIASKLNIPVFLVVYTQGHLERLWVKRVGVLGKWRCFTGEQFQEELHKLYERR